jgi:hypothetical protein
MAENAWFSFFREGISFLGKQKVSNRLHYFQEKKQMPGQGTLQFRRPRWPDMGKAPQGMQSSTAEHWKQGMVPLSTGGMPPSIVC